MRTRRINEADLQWSMHEDGGSASYDVRHVPSGKSARIVGLRPCCESERQALMDLARECLESQVSA